MEDEIYNLTVKGNDPKTYIDDSVVGSSLCQLWSFSTSSILRVSVREDGWCSGDGCSKGCSMVSCSGAGEGDEGLDVGSVTGVGGMVVDSVGAG
ncbi:hypothetical protein Tco_1283431 [Tanacetum coccineum]